MTLEELYIVLSSLRSLRGEGGSAYKQINKLLKQEATTHNTSEASLLLQKLKDSNE